MTNMTTLYQNMKFKYAFKVTFGSEQEGDQVHIVIAKGMKQAIHKAESHCKLIDDHGGRTHEFVKSVESMDGDYVI